MYQKTVLPNGIRIVTEYLPHVRSAALGAWFEVGSRQEEPEEWGLSHFVEHMMFKGTSTHSAREIAEIMDQRGGQLNAFTEREQTCYYFKVLDEHFSTAAGLLQDMLLNSLFLPADVEKEKGVIMEELRMYEDSPEDFVHDLFSHVLWPGDPLGRSILGSEETIQACTPQRLREYVAKHYTADRLVIACAGNVRHEEVVESFARAFARLPRGNTPLASHPRNTPGSCSFRDKDIEQVHLCLGAPAIARSDERRYPLQVLDAIMGGGVSSLLFQQLREELGLVYSTYSFNCLYSDTGFYGVYAGFCPRNWDRVWDVITGLFRNISQLITADMVERSKQQLRSGFILSLESTSARMSRLAKGELYEGGPIPPSAVLGALDQVQHGEVMDLAREIYDPQRWSWAAVGPSRLIKEDVSCRKIC